MDTKDTGSGFFVGFIAGVTIGLVAGFLYAPHSGEETRELLKEKSETVRKKADEVAEKVKEAAETARKKAQEKVEEAKE